MTCQDQFLACFKGVERSGVRELLEWLVTTDFFSAPASTRFHGACAEGLVKHHLAVLRLFLRRLGEYDLKLSYESAVICSLFHDLCKTGLYKEVDGVWTYDRWVINQGHAVRSLRLIQKFVDLTEQEERIIRFHMGAFGTRELFFAGEYSKEDLWRVVDADPLVMLFHHCDDEASKFID